MSIIVKRHHVKRIETEVNISHDLTHIFIEI